MRRLRADLIRLLAAALLLQTAWAPAHCLAHAWAVAEVGGEICGPGGLWHAAAPLGEPDGSASPVADGFCAACHALPQAAALPAPRVPTPAWVMRAVDWSAMAAAGLPPGARAPPYDVRGPPLGA